MYFYLVKNEDHYYYYIVINGKNDFKTVFQHTLKKFYIEGYHSV